jgi:hypothetical protein
VILLLVLVGCERSPIINGKVVDRSPSYMQEFWQETPTLRGHYIVVSTEKQLVTIWVSKEKYDMYPIGSTYSER